MLVFKNRLQTILFSYPRQLKNSASLQSGTLSYHQLITAQASAAAKSTPSGTQAQVSATITTGSGTQASGAGTAPKQPVNTAVSASNSTPSVQRIAGNLQSGYSIQRLSVTPATQQSVRPAVSTPNVISGQKVVVNLPVVNITNLASSPAVASRSNTPNKTVYLTSKTTNASAVSLSSSIVQAVPGPSSASTGTSLVTAAAQGAGNPPSNSAAIPKPSPAK